MIYEIGGARSPKVLTADWTYVRLHGPDGPYRGSYPPQTLAGWAGAFSTWSRDGDEVFCYFDNDEAGYAPANALRLRAMLPAGGGEPA